MLRIPHCLDNRLTDNGKFVSPTHRERSIPLKHYFFCLWYSFLRLLRSIALVAVVTLSHTFFPNNITIILFEDVFMFRNEMPVV
jgi:hypothetical protein